MCSSDVFLANVISHKCGAPVFSWSPCCHWGAFKCSLQNKCGWGDGEWECGRRGRISFLKTFLLLWKALECRFNFRLRCKVYPSPGMLTNPVVGLQWPGCPHMVLTSQGCHYVYNARFQYCRPAKVRTFCSLWYRATTPNCSSHRQDPSVKLLT